MKRGIKLLLISTTVTLFLVMGGHSVFSFTVENWEFGGYLRNETSFKVHDPKEPIWCENRLQLEITNHLIEDRLDFFLMTLGYYDAIYDIKDGGFLKDGSIRRNLRRFFGHYRKDTLADPIREAYLDIFFPNVDIRIGKQQIVWGKTEAFKLLDIVNPTDYRHFVQDSFEDSRITLWAAKVIWQPLSPNNFLEMIAVPDVEEDVIPPYGHPMAFRVTRAGGPPDSTIIKKDHRGWKWNETEWGARWGQNFGDFDYTLDYFYHWSGNPKYKLLGLDFSQGIRPVLETTYKRVHSIGGSFAKNFNCLFGLPHVVIRFETLLNLNDVGTKMTDAGQQSTRTDNFNYCLAIDHTFYRPYKLWPAGLDTTLQFFQTTVLDYDDDFISGAVTTSRDTVKLDRVSNLITLNFMANYLQGETLKTFFLFAYKDDGSWWISPQFNYELTEKITLGIGGHFFPGRADSFIGQMHQSDNVYFRIKYGL